MNMARMSRKYILKFLVIITLFDITNSHNNDTVAERQRHGRVSGRIVKLYSGPKPDPILCLSEGFLADTVDCSVFYRCLKASNGKYTVYRFQCGPGTVYDPDTEICNHPRSTKRLGCGSFSSNKLISSTEKYIENEIDEMRKENQELPSPISTKPPKASSSFLSTVDTPRSESSYITTSYFSTSKHVNSETTTATSMSTKKLWDYTPTQATYYVTRQPSVHSGVQCTSDGFIGDNEDCRKFYRCVNNQRGGYLRYEFSCSDSTIWDDDTQGCNHPWAVQRRRCGKGNNYLENSVSYIEKNKNNDIIPDISIEEPTQISYGSKLTQIEAQISAGPTIQNPIQTHFGDRLSPENQNIQVNNTENSYGVPISQNQTQLNYGNEITQTQVQDDHLSYFSQTQMPNDLLSSSSTKPSNLYSKGNSRCTKAGFVGDSNDCKKFYRCVSDEKGGFTVFEFSCSDGTLWDEQLEACNHAWAVKQCGGIKISQHKPPISAVLENTTVSYHTTISSSLFSNEIDDNGYGSQNNQQNLDQLTSTMTTQKALLTTMPIKSSKPYETTVCKSSGFFGNINDCAKFYRCVENGDGRFLKYEYKCGDGTVWDPEIESCNHAWSVKSCGDNRTKGTEKENIAFQSNTDNTIITTVSLIQTTTQKNIFDHNYETGYLDRETPLLYKTTTKSIVNKRNECETSGFMGDDDCKKFYRCVENGHGGYTRYEFTCGEGTVWDPEIEACNHAWAVKKCGFSSIKDNLVTLSPSVSHDNLNKDDTHTTNQNNDKDPKGTTETTTSKSTTSFVRPVTNRVNDCQSNGFIGNDNDCKIFYRCVENESGGFTRYEFSCGDGTVWDPKISACNHARAVEKCGGSNSEYEYLSSSTENSNFTTASSMGEIFHQHTTLSSSSTVLESTTLDTNNKCVTEGFIGDKHDCKKFYRCVEDGKGSYIRYDFTCGDGTVWDSKIQACNHVWAVKSCGSYDNSHSENTLTSRPTTLKDEYNTDNKDNQETINSTEINSLSSSTVKTSTVMGVSKECATEGFMGDSADCRKFYRCINDGKGSFIRYEFSCGDGTIWDSEINACNHVNSVKTPCSTQNTQFIEENAPDSTINSTTSEVYDYSSTSEKPPKSQDCEQEGFFGDKADCKKFYRCTDNGQRGFQKYEFTCGEGTIWDQEVLACNHASSNLRCGSVDKDSHTDNPNLHSTTEIPGASPSTEKTQTSSNSDECISEGFYANSKNCKNFYRCVGNGKGGFTRYDFTCGEGTIWIQDIQACDHDSDTSLCSKGSLTTTTTTAPSLSTQERPITTISTSTTTSTTTDSSTSTLNTKPIIQDEMVSESSSTSDNSSTTSTSATNDDHCKEPGYFGNSKDCKKFYRCVDNGKGGFTKYDFTCGDGTIWDQDITTCNHPQNVTNPSCESKGDTPTTTTTTRSTPESNGTSQPTKGTSTTESTSTQSNSQSTQEDSTKNPNNNNYTCTEAGFYADPYDCKKFYRCVDWGGDGKTFSIYHFDCGEGTIWDPDLQTCNHEESVYPPRDCSGTQSQNEKNNGTTTTATQEETTQTSTTEGSTTATQSTTQKATTQSTTTSGSTSNTDQTSTQQSSTSESTTSTTQSSTEQSTTEQSTTQKSTTEQSTTEPSTTQQSTTTSDQTTTQQSSTTQKSTTSEATTTTTTEQTTTNEDTTTTTAQTTTTESTTSSSDQTTKAEQSTTQETTEQSSESQSSTTEQSTTQETTDGSSTTESGQDTTTEQESSDKECPQTDSDQYLFVCPTGFKRHPKYCNLFYQCTEDDDSHEMKVAVFSCPNNTIYDESKTQCVEEEKADKKCDGQLAQRRRVKRLDANYKELITVGTEKFSCPAAGHFPFEKNEQCSPILFKCEVSKSGKLRGLIYQCPEGYFYWSISRRCEPVSIMTACKRSLSNWNRRYEIPIERNNVSSKVIQ